MELIIVVLALVFGIGVSDGDVETSVPVVVKTYDMGRVKVFVAVDIPDPSAGLDRGFEKVSKALND